MLGRMAIADDDSPGVAPDDDFLPVDDPSVAIWQGVDVLSEVAEASTVSLERRLAPAGFTIELEGLGRRLATRVGDHDSAGQVLEGTHPEARIELARQPPGQSDMVGMHVGAEDPRDRTVPQGVPQQVAPEQGGLLAAQSGIDQGPAVTVFDRPEIDVIQGERQRHTDPVDPGSHLDCLATMRRNSEGVFQRRSRGDGAIGQAFHLVSLRRTLVRSLCGTGEESCWTTEVVSALI